MMAAGSVGCHCHCNCCCHEQPPPPEGPHAHSRYALSSRKWTAEDVVDGIPVKFTVAEAFCRACEGVRVQVPNPPGV